MSPIKYFLYCVHNRNYIKRQTICSYYTHGVLDHETSSKNMLRHKCPNQSDFDQCNLIKYIYLAARYM